MDKKVLVLHFAPAFKAACENSTPAWNGKQKETSGYTTKMLVSYRKLTNPAPIEDLVVLIVDSFVCTPLSIHLHKSISLVYRDSKYVAIARKEADKVTPTNSTWFNVAHKQARTLQVWFITCGVGAIFFVAKGTFLARGPPPNGAPRPWSTTPARGNFRPLPSPPIFTAFPTRRRSTTLS